MNTADIITVFKLIKHICTVPCSYVNNGFQLTKTEGGRLKGMEGGPGRHFTVANSKEKRSIAVGGSLDVLQASCSMSGSFVKLRTVLIDYDILYMHACMQ
jgi:hypothetical protein